MVKLAVYIRTVRQVECVHIPSEFDFVLEIAGGNQKFNSLKSCQTAMIKTSVWVEQQFTG